MPRQVFDCVVPAAGASSRMGAWKPLLPWGGSTIIETIVNTVLEAGLRPIVVAGFRGGELRALLGGREGLLVVDNPDWEGGMAGSLLAGAGEVRGEAFFVLPADMPGVGAGIFRLLLAARLEGAARDETLFASCRGQPGHPVLIPTALLPALGELEIGQRARDLLMARPHRLVETGDPAVLADLDTEAEYRAARPGAGPGGFPA